MKKKFEGQLISRYPLEDWPYYPLPQNLMTFMFSSGIWAEKEDPKVSISPQFFSFTLTNEEGSWVYVSVLSLKENPLDPSLEIPLKAFNIVNPKEIVIPKALVIISHYSFINNCKEFLKSLYSVHLSKSILPLERYITNFVDEIPRPDKGNLCV